MKLSPTGVPPQPTRLFTRAGRAGFALALIAGLAGCASAPPMQAPVPMMKQPPLPPSVQAYPLAMPTVRQQNLPASNAPSSNGAGNNSAAMQALPTASAPAVMALVTRAETQTRAGDLGGAEATLERAVQIQPHDTRLWMDFAQLRLVQNQPAEAEQFALRAVQYAGTNRELSAAWMLVAKAREAQGNVQGAAEAQRKAGSPSAPANQTRS